MADTVSAAGAARFHRCALQVNPFAYVTRHARPTPYTSEADYNNALVSALVTAGVEVICVTDHYRVSQSASLSELARTKGLHAFHGFEAVSKDGVHFLCIFDDTVPLANLERMIGECGVRDDAMPSPTGELDALELLEKAPEWGAVMVGAHASSTGGVLAQLAGQSRARVWTSDNLLAISLPGPADEAPPEHRDILLNRDPAYKRTNPIAVLNAQDADDPTAIGDSAKSCLIKMTSPSVEALRQSFLDPDSRIRLLTDELPGVPYEIRSLSWEGGFLDGVSLSLSPHMNCFIGGRGTGKSTVIESIRAVFALPPLGKEARKSHEAVAKNVIRPGTKIVAEVAVNKPLESRYTVEVILPGAPLVRNRDGTLSSVAPGELIPGLEVYGQHEISELANDPRALTDVLARFLEPADREEGALRSVRRDLDTSRTTVLALEKRRADLEDRVAALPRLEEQLKRFEDAGFAEHLKEQTAVINEAAELNAAEALLEPLADIHARAAELLPLDTESLAFTSLAESPIAGDVELLQKTLSALSTSAAAASDSLDTALGGARDQFAAVRGRHDERRKVVEKRTQALLRSLGAGSTDGQEYLRTKSKIRELIPLRAELTKLSDQLDSARRKRQELLSSLEDSRAKQFRALEKAAKRVTKKLEGAARVTVQYHGERGPLFDLLKRVPGRMAETVAALERIDALTPSGLAAKIREGAAALKATYHLPSGAAERLALASGEVLMDLEQLELNHTTAIELNVAAEGTEPKWRNVNELSAGQRATAVLLLLLLESSAPLIVDQPEDDLDNRFIFDTIVPRMRAEKHRRQLIFATHNANIPVLGDAELIAGFHATSEGGGVDPEHVGALDRPSVKELVEQVLEGGREAFELRRRKYRY